MTKLEAVNYLLAVLGESPVGDLSNKNPNVSVCEDALDAAIVSVTSNGFWFNEVYNVRLSQDPTTKKINTTGYTKIISRNTYAVQRGDFLFDPHNNTYEFDNYVEFDGVSILDFTLLPDNVQQACQFFAAVQLCTTDLEDTTKRGEEQEFYNNAFLQMKKEDLEIKRRNAQTSPRVAAARYRVAPMRERRRYGPNFGGRGY